MIQKFLYSKPGSDVVIERLQQSVFVYRELTPPVKLEITYYLRASNQHVRREVTVKSLYPKCLQDTAGWQKPYWCIEKWREL